MKLNYIAQVTNQVEQAVQLQLKKKIDELTGQTEFYSDFFSLNFHNLI